ncbi:MAG: hypothetical protein ACYST5_20100, partial [Planctomycetota bacterium]
MLKGKLLALLLALCIALPGCSASGMPGRIGPWRVEFGTPGNEFYEVPAAKLPPPSDAVLQWVKIFAPGVKVKEWEIDDGVYEIDAEAGDEEYKFYVTPKGELLG